VRFAALGDSFTEGVGDERADGSPRGWADLVAAGLAAHDPAETWYVNLAIRGRLLEAIVTEQLDAALALDPLPTIVTINGGGNDMMRPGADLVRLISLLLDAVDRCQRAGVTPVLLAGADPSDRLPFGRVLHRRAAELTDATARLAQDRRVLFVNAFGDTEIRAARYWSEDRLHLNPFGHRRVAALVLAALGAEATGPAPLALEPPSPGPLAEARYYWRHVRPWMTRRLTGRSSGDGRAGKHAGWTLIEPAAV
jgi:lysophospholipase L1-like esterase